MLLTLTRTGDALTLTVPESFVAQNGLQEGSQVELSVTGTQMTVTAPRRPRYQLEALLAEMPVELPIDEAWEGMAPAGKEKL